VTHLSDFPPDVQALTLAVTRELSLFSTAAMQAEVATVAAHAVMADRAARLDFAGLRPRQADCLRFIADYQRRHDGVSPTYDEIASGIGAGGKSNVARLLDELEDLGRIKRLPNRSRAITIIPNPAN
jgi:hypothetical protein